MVALGNQHLLLLDEFFAQLRQALALISRRERNAIFGIHAPDVVGDGRG